MNKKTIILGGGFIGRKLESALGAKLLSARITTYQDVENIIKKHHPDVLINCIGHTGKRNVDDCELVPDKTLSANTFVPILLAEAAFRHKIKLVHISSGCIFHYDYKKNNAIREERVADYFDLFYSRTKIYTENVLMQLAELKDTNILITRIRVPLDSKPHPKNLLTKLIKYQRVIDAPNSVTYVPDFIEALKHLLKIDARGIYNTVVKEPLVYPDLLNAYCKLRPDFHFDVIRLKELKLTRTSLIMSTNKLEKTGFKVRSIKEIIKECVNEYVKY
ncbi:MAG: sugar nucleotide-binding protein [Candidatus Omnitrophica bacterium]|nr:sugar nucleotide-binding protein [Candidatus Omnitrophota bacterium]